MAVPYTFGSILGGASIPLSELDDNFSYLTTSPTFTGNITVNGSVDSFGVTSYFGGSNPLAYTGVIVRNTASNGYASTGWWVGNSGANGVASVNYAPGIFLKFGVLANDTTSPIVFVNNNDQERMRIAANGNVGVGTSSPASRVNIKGNNEALRIDADFGLIRGYGADSTTSVGFIQFNKSYDVIISAEQSIPIVFRTNAIERARIDSSGNLGVGTTSPVAKLDVYGGAGAATSSVRAASGQNAFLSVIGNGNSFLSTSFDIIQDATNTAQIFQRANAPLVFGTNNTERARIDSSGNLGVGTTSPSSKLHASSPSSFVQITAEYNGSGAAGINFKNGGSSTGYIYYDNGANMLFYTANSERARIDSSGNLLVGTTDNSQTSGPGVKIKNSGGTSGVVSCVATQTDSSADTYHVYSTGAGAYRFYVELSGAIRATSTSIVAISDISLKENIRDLETGLDEILRLKPRRFDWREETKLGVKDVAGFIAQEVEPVLPDLVSDGKYTDEKNKKFVKMGDMIPTMVKAIQELAAKVTELEEKLNAK